LVYERGLKEAYKAYGKNETPIGAVMVKDGSIIARDIIKRNLRMTPPIMLRWL